MPTKDARPAIRRTRPVSYVTVFDLHLPTTPHTFERRDAAAGMSSPSTPWCPRRPRLVTKAAPQGLSPQPQ